MTRGALEKILQDHKKWLLGEPGGIRANLRDANLRDANLGDANLGGANLRGANLRDANLRDADLRDADLRDADLRDADLRDADLRGANLRGANLRDADLRTWTYLRHAAVQFSWHGERGRALMGIRFESSGEHLDLICCGCFRGTAEQLRGYIAGSDPDYAPSRTVALEILLRLLDGPADG